MKKLLLVLTLLCGLNVVAEDTNVTFAVPVDIRSKTDIEFKRIILRKMANVERGITRAGVVKQSSYLGYYYYEANRALHKGDLDYVYIYLDKCEDRLIKAGYLTTKQPVMRK